MTEGATEVTFYYDHGTHWVTANPPTPIVTAVGQLPVRARLPGRLGRRTACAAGCRIPTATACTPSSTASIPAGSYAAKATVGLSFDENYGAGGAAGGADIPFTVPSGAVTRFSYDSVSHALTVTSGASTAADLSASKAQWIQRGLLAWDLPAEAAGWTLPALRRPDRRARRWTSEAVTGGDSIPLTLDPAGLPGRHRRPAGRSWPGTTRCGCATPTPATANCCATS